MLNSCVQEVAANVRRLLKGIEVSVYWGKDACQGEWVCGRVDRWVAQCVGKLTVGELRSAPFWDITQGIVVIPYRRFETTFGPVCKGREIQEEPRTQLQRGESLKSHNHDSVINLLKPTGHVMHKQFNIQQLYALPTLYLCLCIYLRTNSDLCHLQHKLIGFYNRDEKCSLRGMDWVFK